MLEAAAGLFSAKDARTKRLRELIVDLEAPAPQTPAPAAAESAVQQSGLNAEQECAVKRCRTLLIYAVLKKENKFIMVLPKPDSLCQKPSVHLLLCMLLDQRDDHLRSQLTQYCSCQDHGGPGLHAAAGHARHGQV